MLSTAMQVFGNKATFVGLKHNLAGCEWTAHGLEHHASNCEITVIRGSLPIAHLIYVQTAPFRS